MKKILITGAGRGLGLALIDIYASNDYITYPIVRSQEDSKYLKSKYHNCFPIVADLNNDNSTKIIHSFLQEHTQSLDIIINNAGISGKGHLVEQVDPQEINNLFNIHCLGAIRVVKACLVFMKNSSNPRIINVSSRLGSLTRVSSGEFKHLNFSYSYRIAKASQNMMTVCLSEELKDANICVCAVHPGRLNTRGGSADAEMSAEDGANEMYHWIEKININNSGEYIENGQVIIPW